MKKLFLVMSAFVIAASGNAQNQKNAVQGSPLKDAKMEKDDRKADDEGVKAEDRGNRDEIFAKLGLRDEQKEKMKAMDESFKKSMQELSKNTSLSEEERRQKRMELLKERKAQMDAILSPEQRERLTELKKEGGQNHEAHGADEHRRGGMGDRFADMIKDLNLSPDQQGKMKELNEKFRAKMTEIQNTTTDPDKKKEEMMSAMKQHREDLKALLTDEQQAKLKEKMKDRRDNN